MLLAVHVACYVASSTLMGQQKKFIIDMDIAGDGLHYTHRVLVAARTIADKYFPGLPAVTNAAADATRPWGLDPVSTFVDQLGVAATRTRESHYGVYLGFETLRRLDNGARAPRALAPAAPAALAPFALRHFVFASLNSAPAASSPSQEASR